MSLYDITHINIMLFARIFLSLTLYYLSIPTIMKILLLLSIDGIKGLFIYPFIKNKTSLSTFITTKQFISNNYYQKTDKLVDLLTYCLVYFVVVNNNLKIDHKLLACTLLWRFIGVSLYLKTGYGKYLMYCPDLFKEYLFILYFFETQKSLKLSLITIITILKFRMEYEFHIKRHSGETSSVIYAGIVAVLLLIKAISL